MSTETARLRMLPAKQLAFDHRHSANACAQGHHHHFGKIPGGTCVEFAQQCHSRIILDAQREAKSLLTPRGKIDFFRIVILSIRRQYLSSAGIDQCSKAHRNTCALFE
jgi:hypothetical protein